MQLDNNLRLKKVIIHVQVDIIFMRVHFCFIVVRKMSILGNVVEWDLSNDAVVTHATVAAAINMAVSADKIVTSPRFNQGICVYDLATCLLGLPPSLLPLLPLLPFPPFLPRTLS